MKISYIYDSNLFSSVCDSLFRQWTSYLNIVEIDDHQQHQKIFCIKHMMNEAYSISNIVIQSVYACMYDLILKVIATFEIERNMTKKKH